MTKHKSGELRCPATALITLGPDLLIGPGVPIDQNNKKMCGSIFKAFKQVFFFVLYLITANAIVKDKAL